MEVDFNRKRIVIKAPILTSNDYIAGFVNDLIRKFQQAGFEPILFAGNTKETKLCHCIKANLTFANPRELVSQMVSAAKEHNAIIVSSAGFDDTVGDYIRLETLLDIIDQTDALKDIRLIFVIEVSHLTKPFLSGTIGYFFQPTPQQILDSEKFDSFCEKRNYRVITIGNEYFANDTK